MLQGTDGPWAAAFAQAMSGSPALYSQTEPAEGEWWASNGGRKWKGGRAPAHSVNFVTAHDGFSLADLTAYNEKHNEANGEDNRCACKLGLKACTGNYASYPPSAVSGVLWHPRSVCILSDQHGQQVGTMACISCSQT